MFKNKKTMYNPVGGAGGSSSSSSVTFLTTTATLNFPSTTGQSGSDLTVTLTGAALNDSVCLGVPNGSMLTNSSYFAWVSATNTVTVRFNNYDSITKDPASGTFRVSIIK